MAVCRDSDRGMKEKDFDPKLLTSCVIPSNSSPLLAYFSYLRLEYLISKVSSSF